MSSVIKPSKLKSWQTWYTGIAILYMYLPIAVLAVFSFNASSSSARWTGFTLDWYAKFLKNPTLLSALGNSLTVAFIAVSISAVLGTLTAVGLSRYYFLGKNLYRGVTFLPLVIPDIAIAVATLVFFGAIQLPLNLDLGLFQLPLNLARIITAHIVFCMAYVTVVVSSRLAGLDPRIEEAALDLGATPMQAFFQVLMPQLLPGILSGCLLAFILSMDDFVIAYFTAGVGATTLPMAIFTSLRTGVTPELNALSVLLISASAAIALIAEYVRNWGKDK
jgi:spermidine/putrescine transport system permease protein